jgi:hypothetical protein
MQSKLTLAEAEKQNTIKKMQSALDEKLKSVMKL